MKSDAAREYFTDRLQLIDAMTFITDSFRSLAEALRENDSTIHLGAVIKELEREACRRIHKLHAALEGRFGPLEADVYICDWTVTAVHPRQ